MLGGRFVSLQHLAAELRVRTLLCCIRWFGSCCGILVGLHCMLVKVVDNVTGITSPDFLLELDSSVLCICCDATGTQCWVMCGVTCAW